MLTPEQEAALAKIADERLAADARSDAQSALAVRVAAARAAVDARQAKLRAAAKALFDGRLAATVYKSPEYRALVTTGDAEVRALSDAVRVEESR